MRLEPVIKVHMSRIRINHDLDDVASQSERILVIADKPVLEDSDDEAVAMEDVDLARIDREKAKERRAKHGKRFNPYEDEWNRVEESVLSKYDDFDEKEKQLRASKAREITLGVSLRRESGTSMRNSSEYDANEEMPTTIKVGPSNSRNFYGTSSSGEILSFQSDFFTQNETASFRKVSKEKKKKRKVAKEEQEESEEMKEILVVHDPEEDSELYSQLSRLRRLERSKTELFDETNIADVIRENRDEDLDHLHLAPIASAGVTSFLSRLEVARLIAQERPEETDQNNNQALELPPFDTSMIVTVEQAEEEPVQNSVEKAEPVMEDVKIDSGLACALKFFQDRGDIKRQEKGDVRLEHRDEFGRVLNPKEAYKQLSWKFHGVKPSAAKQEKRLRKIDNEIKAQLVDSGSSVSMKAMHDVQKEGKSHLVIPYK